MILRKILKYVSYSVVALGIVYAVGPRPKFQSIPPVVLAPTVQLSDLEQHVARKEASVSLRPDNHARIIWADSVRQTEYAVVYLHGFSATHEEGNPVHRDFARRYGCNLYLPRLPMHGESDPDAFKNMTPKALIEGAAEAISYGKILGKKVILLSCSTGGTLGLYLAQHDPDITGIFLYSPNIDIANPASELLTGPWGQEIAELVSDGKYHKWQAPIPEVDQYWSTTYRIEGLSAVKELVETTMLPATWAAVKQPVFLAYYYKDDEHQDPVVSVAEMLRCFDGLGTPTHQKRKVALPDAGVHVIAHGLQSKAITQLEQETYRFAEEVLGLKAVIK